MDEIWKSVAVGVAGFLGVLCVLSAIDYLADGNPGALMDMLFAAVVGGVILYKAFDTRR